MTQSEGQEVKVLCFTGSIEKKEVKSVLQLQQQQQPPWSVGCPSELGELEELEGTG